MKAAKADKRLVACLFHPDAAVGLQDMGDGVNANVLVGNPAYQLTSGEIVAL